MDSTSRTVDILVPGYGHGFVDRELCHNKRQRTISPSEVVHVSQGRRLSQASASRLNIAFCDFEYFARYRGTNIRTLTLDHIWGLQKDQLAQVITHCPRLESLTVLTCGVKSLHQLIDAYENGLPLSTLRLMDLFAEDGESLLEFLRFLADPSSAITNRLETLCLGNKSRARYSLPPGSGRILGQVVCKNTKLQYVQVCMRSVECAAYRVSIEEWQAKHDDVDDILNRTVTKSLSSRAKCAFLSTFPHRHSSAGTARSSLLKDLDMRATTLIFVFAAVPTIRRLIIEEWSEQRGRQ